MQPGDIIRPSQERQFAAQPCEGKFRVPEFSFTGQRVGVAGIHTTRHKVHVIVVALSLTSKQSLYTLMGLLSFYDRFLEQRATVARDLYKLRLKDVAWSWEEMHHQAFQSLKQLLL